jgi:3',5'-cyclic AMP phosphodiesterase CpdA
MFRRVLIVGVVALGLVPVAGPAGAVPVETTVRTIQDLDNDNFLEFAPGEDHIVLDGPEGFQPPQDGSIINFLQMSDFQMVDEESPARVEFLDTTQRGPFNPFSAAYRPQESLTTQVAEAMVRAARNARSPITQELLDLTILTGDNADSQQYNETRWFIDILDGDTFVNPDSGIPTVACPDPTPATVYDGVQGGGQAVGYYDPDASGPEADGDGYSPDPDENQTETGRRVTVRDFPGLFEAANQRFMALGLDMPWYTAFGNHDALVQGNSPYAYTGPFGPSGELWGEPQNVVYHEVATGCVKVSNATTSIFTDDVLDPDDPISTVAVPPDDRRCFLAKDFPSTSPAGTPCFESSWIQEHFVTTGSPVGHGLAPGVCEPNPIFLDPTVCPGYGRPVEAISNHDGYYSFSPSPGLRFAVLDSVTDECGALFCSEGSIDDAQFQWLDEQIQLAQLSGEYVLVFSHHTLATTRWPSIDLTEEPIHYGRRFDRENPASPQNPATVGETLEELYCRSPNVLAHIDGHEHENFVDHYTCEGPEPVSASGPGDFWEISTAAHIDWPQQARMIELIDNGDHTMSLVLTILDHAGPPNPGGAPSSSPPDFTANGASGQQVLKLASIGRELAYNDYQGSRGARGGPDDRNVIIVLDKPWPYPTD